MVRVDHLLGVYRYLIRKRKPRDGD